MPEAKARNAVVCDGRKLDFKAEAVEIRAFVDATIRKGKAKAFLVDHGFITKGGQITKRYGG